MRGGTMNLYDEIIKMVKLGDSIFSKKDFNEVLKKESLTQEIKEKMLY